MRRQILRSKICGRAMLAPTFRIERCRTKRGCCSSLCNRLLINLGLGWSTNRVGGGSAARPTRSEQESPVPNETGDFQSNLYFPIRRADTSDQSGGFTRLPSSRMYQARNASGGSPLSTCRPGLRQRRLHQRRDRACRRPGSRWSARRRPRRRR